MHFAINLNDLEQKSHFFKNFFAADLSCLGNPESGARFEQQRMGLFRNNQAGVRVAVFIAAVVVGHDAVGSELRVATFNTSLFVSK